MSGELAVVESGSLKIQTIDDLSRVSKMFAMSGYFEDCKDIAQAGVKILAGNELGIPAFAAMTGIHVIKGKASIGANLMAAKVRASQRYDYIELQHDDQGCRIAFYEKEFSRDIKDLRRAFAKGELTRKQFEERIEVLSLGVSTFTKEDAAKAGTQNMQKFPRNMLFARAMSNGVKWFCPDIFLGTPVYVPEEMGATVDDEGNVVEVIEVEPELPSKPQPIKRAEPKPVEVEVVSDDVPKPGFITQQQIKRMMAGVDKGWTEESIKALLIANYGIESRKAIPQELYDEICGVLSTPPIQEQPDESKAVELYAKLTDSIDKAQTLEDCDKLEAWLKAPKQWNAVHCTSLEASCLEMIQGKRNEITDGIPY